MAEVRCGGCRAVLDEAASMPEERRTPCPSCGSLARLVCLSVRDELSPSLKEKIDTKARR